MTDPIGYRLYRSLSAGVPRDPGHMIADLGNAHSVRRSERDERSAGTSTSRRLCVRVRKAVRRTGRRGASGHYGAAPPSSFTAILRRQRRVHDWTRSDDQRDGTPLNDLAGIQIFRNDATSPRRRRQAVLHRRGSGNWNASVLRQAYDEAPNVAVRPTSDPRR